ncbi:MAG: VIT1/CCC1 transporter family protein [Bryobacteraceae bacterium]
MPATPHMEQHFTATEAVRDVVIGMSDGLTVPFALAAGLSGAVDKTSLVVIAGLAEIAAGSIAMGLGGYLAARTDFEHYNAELEREYREIRELPEEEEKEVAAVFHGYGLTAEQAAPVVAAIRSDPKRWVDFMMRYELGLEAPDPRRALRSALTIGFSYIVGGLIPLSPYMLSHTVLGGLRVSVVLTLAALFVFGYGKGRLTGIRPLRGGLRTVVIGGLAAAAAFGIARLIS